MNRSSLPSSSLPILFSVVALAGCKPKPESRPSATTSATAQPSAVASIAPEPPREAPLAWGTRPPQTGPFYPVVDGMCIHAEVWKIDNGALFTYGNGTGPWSRGTSTTYARFVDGGIDSDPAIGKEGPSAKKDVLANATPLAFFGSWPDAIAYYSNDSGGGRMREYPTVWMHGSEGWNPIASHTEPTEPYYTKPVFFRGSIVYARIPYDDNEPSSTGVLFYAKPLTKDAPALPNIASLLRPGLAQRTIAASEDAIYFVGVDVKKYTVGALRIYADGKTREIPMQAEQVGVIGTKPSLTMLIDEKKIVRLTDDKLVPVDTKSLGNAAIAAASVAPNGDIWVLTKNDKLFVVRDGKTDEMALPEPKTPAPKEAVQHWPATGSLLAGVEVDDVWVSARGGILYHLVSGNFEIVDLPKPPFSTSGRYLAQAIVVAKKGDVYVNAGYAEKGVGWKSAERYRAILRTTRPTEVLRCNEPFGGWNSGSGSGFMSFPPIADETCKTPFVVLLRTGYGSGKDASRIYEAKHDFSQVREAIKETPSLTSSPLPAEARDAAPEGEGAKRIALVELQSGKQRYLGAKVPSVAAGRDLALAVVKRVKTIANGGSIAEVRPEIVCGEPKPERTINVDATTGKVID